MSGRIDRIEITKFITLVNHFSEISENKEHLIENKSSIIWFIKIYKAMKDRDVSLNLFNRLLRGSDRINYEEFKQKIAEDLRLFLDDNFKVFINFISLSNGDVSYTKFEEGYGKE